MALKDEIKKKGPFQSLAQEAFLALIRTAGRLEAQSAEFFRPYGISPTQYNVLRILRGAQATCCDSGLPCGEISDRMVTRDPDITRLLDRMEKAGLIERVRSSKDRRVVQTAITAAGLKLLADLDDKIVELHRQQLGHMKTTELKQLITLLEQARKP